MKRCPTCNREYAGESITFCLEDGSLLSQNDPDATQRSSPLSTRNDPDATHRSSPYLGLIPYGEADAPFFFGREKETRLIIANLFASPLTLLYGASGVGKSSVLRAGVAHQLRDREDLLVVVFNAWQAPMNLLFGLKLTIEFGRIEKLRSESADFEPVAVRVKRAYSRSLIDQLADCAEQLNRRLMIILDQFEEYFLYHPSNDQFAEEFSRAVTQFSVPVSFLISIREDFYAKLDRFEGRIPNLYDNYLRIEHLDPRAARVAIEQPIAAYNHLYATNGKFSIEPELVEAVLKQVEAGRVVIGEAGRVVVESKENEDPRIETPFLQLVMDRVWKEELGKGSSRLRLETLNQLDGAENIVRTHLDSFMNRLSAPEQEIAAKVFHYLVTPSGTKIAYTASDLAGSAELKEPQVLEVLKKLSDGDVRVLRTVDAGSDRSTEPRYEIFHDVLAPAVLAWRTSFKAKQNTRQLADTLESMLEKLVQSGELDPRLSQQITSLNDPEAIDAILAKLKELGADKSGPQLLKIADYYQPRNKKYKLEWPLSPALPLPVTFDDLDEESQFHVLFAEWTRREMEATNAVFRGDFAAAQSIFEECLERAKQLEVAELRVRSYEGFIRVAQNVGDREAERKWQEVVLAERAIMSIR